MDDRRYRLAGVYGDKRDRLAYAQWALERLRGVEPCVALASCAETEYLARSGDALISGCAGRLTAETVSLSTGERRPLTEYVPDVARICAGAGEFVDVLAPREYHSRIGGDMYWYNAAASVLRDVYDCAVCDCFAAEDGRDENAGEAGNGCAADGTTNGSDERKDIKEENAGTAAGSGEDVFPSRPVSALSRGPMAGVGLVPLPLDANVLRIVTELGAHVPGERRTTEKMRAADSFLRRWPEEYTRGMRVMVVENAPNTAGSIMSIASSAVRPLEPFSVKPSSGTHIVGRLPDDFRGVVFVLSDTFRTDDSAPVAVAACVRLIGGRLGENARVFVLSGRDYDVARSSRASVTLLNDAAVDKAGRADCHIFLPGRHSLFETFVDEKNAHLLRRLPVEEPKNLEYGECLVYRGGEWSYRDDVLPEMPGETVSVRVERSSDSDDSWMREHAERRLEHGRKEAERLRKEGEEDALCKERMRRAREMERAREEAERRWEESREAERAKKERELEKKEKRGKKGKKEERTDKRDKEKKEDGKRKDGPKEKTGKPEKPRQTDEEEWEAFLAAAMKDFFDEEDNANERKGDGEDERKSA